MWGGLIHFLGTSWVVKVGVLDRNGGYYVVSELEWDWARKKKKKGRRGRVVSFQESQSNGVA